MKYKLLIAASIIALITSFAVLRKEPPLQITDNPPPPYQVVKPKLKLPGEQEYPPVIVTYEEYDLLVDTDHPYLQLDKSALGKLASKGDAIANLLLADMMQTEAVPDDWTAEDEMRHLTDMGQYYFQAASLSGKSGPLIKWLDRNITSTSKSDLLANYFMHSILDDMGDPRADPELHFGVLHKALDYNPDLFTEMEFALTGHRQMLAYNSQRGMAYDTGVSK